jgi:hypothetical protein
MNQGGGVDHFDDSAHLDSVFTAAPGEAGREKNERGAQTLAAALLEVLADGGYGVNGANRFDVDCFFDTTEVFAHEFEDFGCAQNLACSL